MIIPKLIVRGRREERPFAQGLSRNLAFRDLIEPASDNRVVLLRKTGSQVDLFELVPSIAPVSVTFLPTHDGRRLRIQMNCPIDAVALELQGETGITAFVEASVGRRPVSARQPSWLVVSLPFGDPRVVELTIQASTFTDGLALARVFVRPEHGPAAQCVWCPLRNSRGDTYALLLVSPDLAIPNSDLKRRFETLSSWLSDCYAFECWSEMDRTIKSRWEAIGRAVAVSPGGRGALMMAAAVAPPDHASASWIPIAHPVQVLPDLYGAPASEFAALAGSPDPGVAELAKLFLLGRARLRDQSQLDVTVYLAFRNCKEASSQDVPLKGFDPQRFFANLPLVDHDPSAGWFWRGEPILGPDHWRAAHLRFLERLEVAGMFTSEEVETGANSRREEALLRLVAAVWKNTPNGSRPPVPSRTVTQEGSQHHDMWASSALSEFARASQMGTVNDLIGELCSRLQWSTREVLTTFALLLRLAPELFSFYLLIWKITKDRP